MNTYFTKNYELPIKLFKELEKSSKQSQRALSKQCGVSLGSIHYCLNTLVERGYVESKNFKNDQNKLAYAYVLTPLGISFKKELTMAFLKSKKIEYKALQRVIKALEEELKR